MNFRDIFQLEECKSLLLATGFDFGTLSTDELALYLYAKCGNRELAPIVESVMSGSQDMNTKISMLGNYFGFLFNKTWSSIKDTYQKELDVFAIKSNERVEDNTTANSTNRSTSSDNDDNYTFDETSAVPSSTTTKTDEGSNDNKKNRIYTMETSFDREENPVDLIHAKRKYLTESFQDFIVDSLSRELVLSVY